MVLVVGDCMHSKESALKQDIVLSKALRHKEHPT